MFIWKKRRISKINRHENNIGNYAAAVFDSGGVASRTAYTANELNHYTSTQENEDAAFVPVFDADGNQSKETTTDYVGHELTHRLQECQNRSGKVCLDFLKNEVEAYKTHVSGCDNIIAFALNSIRIGKLCKEEELTQEVIAKARAYCKELK